RGGQAAPDLALAAAEYQVREDLGPDSPVVLEHRLVEAIEPAADGVAGRGDTGQRSLPVRREVHVRRRDAELHERRGQLEATVLPSLQRVVRSAGRIHDVDV